jgi:hypothetical protein
MEWNKYLLSRELTFFLKSLFAASEGSQREFIETSYIFIFDFFKIMGPLKQFENYQSTNRCIDSMV